MIEERIGDLFAQEDLKALAHGCNCAGAMGKGIAVGFKERYPQMYKLYQSFCKAGAVPGEVFPYYDRDTDVVIYNLMTQRHWTTPATIEAIEQSVRTMMEMLQDIQIKTVGIPKIGCGLGGLNWDDVRPTLDELSCEHGVTIVVVSLQ